MKLQDQVCTLEQAKRLGELGVIQARSLFFYDTEKKIVYNPWLSSGGYQYPEFCFSAFTVAELGVMFPDGSDCRGKHWAQFQTFRVIKGVQPSQQWCCYCDESSPSGSTEDGDVYKVAHKVYGHTEAQARAAMLIYLLENKLTTPEECNQRLIN